MVYRHDKFQLDEERQIVFDEVGNELRIFGNEYLLLEHLCKNKQATHKDLAELLGFGKIYSGEGIKHIAEKINGWIKEDVVKFKEEKFFLQGEIEEARMVFKKDEKEEVEQDGLEEKKSGLPFNLSWQMIVVIGLGIAVSVLLIKYILDLM